MPIGNSGLIIFNEYKTVCHLKLNMIQYEVNKGINKPIEIKGLKGQYIGYLAAGVGMTLIVFALCYVAGLSMYACLAIATVLAGAVFFTVFHLSATYGEHGLMKKMARKQVPENLVIRSRNCFTGLMAQ